MSEQENSGRDSAEAASTRDSQHTKSSPESEGMKRAAAKRLIERYYFQLTNGCGRADCTNTFCASSSEFSFKNISANDAFVKALELVQKKVQLCETESEGSKIRKAESEVSGEASKDGHDASVKETVTALGASQSASCSSASSSTASKTTTTSSEKKPEIEIPFHTEETVESMLTVCKAEDNWSVLIRSIGQIFSSTESLIKSFNKRPSKEALQSKEGEKDIDTQESDDDKTEEDGGDNSITVKDSETDEKIGESISLDIDALRRAYAKLFAHPEPPFQAALINAVLTLSRNIEMELKYNKPFEQNPNYLNIFLIVMEIPILHSPEFIDTAFPQFCKAVDALPMEAQARLARIWATYPAKTLKDYVGSLQQLISVKVISTPWERLPAIIVQDNSAITGATKVLRILYYASILGGKRDSAQQIAEEKVADADLESSMNEMYQGAIGRDPKEREKPREDPLAKALNVKPTDCYEPLVEWEDFINEPLSDLDLTLMEKDYYHYRTDDKDKFSFLHYPFVLTAAAKHMGLYFDNKIRMLNERRSTLYQSLIHGRPGIPYLRLKVRRDHLIDDALLGLEMAAMENPQDLKKQLYVEFDGEEGVDEGGVSKEFFQLIVEELFNPDIGMFTYNEETRQFWFNPTSFENDGQFTLIGIVLGLAIYNNVILDVHFPMVVYKKLLGKKGSFHDLAASHPSLARSLQQLLDYEGNVEEAFMQPFQVGYHDVFGSSLTHVLKEGGDKIVVTNDTRQEFVNLYSDFLLNKSIDRQFRAFKRGFQMVTDESPLRVFFRPEEVELLVCGSKQYDFNALEESTDYDGGFTAESRTIRNFWEVVHELTDDQKRQILQFTTGSDRVPVGGLSKLKLIIAKNGPDSSRLPTSHTCFNVLLLPDYATKEKLKERLLKAITHAKGFGML